MFALMTLLLSLIFIMTFHPLLMVLILLLLVFLLAHFFSVIIKLSWLSYMFILMIASGMMIMFVYMASLTPNEPKFFIYPKKMSYFLLILAPFIILAQEQAANPSLFNKNYFTMITSIPSFSSIMIFMIIYLLILLLMLFMIIPLDMGPLRS